MANRNLELTLRARADTRELERLSSEMDGLVVSMKRLSSAVDGARDDARSLAGAYGQLTQQEARSVEQASRLARAVAETAAARERAASAAVSAGDAEARTVAAQQQQQQAAIAAAEANERLAQSKLGSISSTGQAATAEEKLASERRKTLDSTDRAAKEEQDVAEARERSRKATQDAGDAEDQLNRKRSAAGSIGGLLQKGLAVAGGLFAAQQFGQALLDFGRDSIMAASMVQESTAKFKTVFRDAATSVEKDLDIMAEANRRSIYDLMAYSATLQDTFVPLGFARDTAAEMSKTVVQLGLDLAAFNNSSDSEAITRLTSALVGNAEAVRAYGIVLTESVVKAELAAIGADKFTGAALEQAKAQARLNVILRSTTDAQGAAIREAEGFSSTLKAFQAAVLDLKVGLGEGLLPPMTDLVNLAVELVNTLSGVSMEGFAKGFDDSFARAEDVEGQVARLRILRNTVIENGNFIDRFDAKLGVVIPGTEAIVASIAQSSSSAEEFAMWLEKAGINAIDLPNRLTGIDRLLISPEGLIAAYFEYEQAAKRAALAAADAAGADQVLRNRSGSVPPPIDPDEIEEARGAISLFGSDAEQALKKYAAGLLGAKQATTEALEAAKALRETWLGAFDSAPVDDVLNAQRELADLQSRRAGGEFVAQADIDAAAQAVIDANRAVGVSYKERALEALSAKALEEGNFQAVASIAQAAVAMGLMSQAEADMRTSFANTVIEVDKLVASLDGLSASAQGSAVAGLAAGVYDTAEAARQAAENLDAVRQFWANGPQGDIGSFYQGLSDPDRLAEIETELGIRIAEETRAEYETWRAGLDEYAATEYKSTIATEFGASITDFRDLKTTAEEYARTTYTSNVEALTAPAQSDLHSVYTRLQELTANEWVVRLRLFQYGDNIAAGGQGGQGGGGGGGNGGNSDSTSTNGSTFVVEGVTVNNYSGGPGVADQTRRGVLAAFRSLA